MSRKKMKEEETDPLTGLILFTGIAIVTLVLFTKDLNMLIYAIPIIFALIVAVSRSGNKDIDDSIQSIGITSYKLQDSLIIGISAGIILFVVGGFLIELTPSNTASIVPVFTILGLTTASIIPSYLYTSTNILAQWIVVAPAEELGWRFLTPFILNSIIKILPLALLISVFMWIFIHIPTLLLQSAPIGMYIVLLLIGIVAIGLIYLTKSLVSAIISHATFNTLVLSFGSELGITGIVTLVIIAVILFFLFFLGGDSNGSKKLSF